MHAIQLSNERKDGDQMDNDEDAEKSKGNCDESVRVRVDNDKTEDEIISIDSGNEASMTRTIRDVIKWHDERKDGDRTDDEDDKKRKTEKKENINNSAPEK